MTPSLPLAGLRVVEMSHMVMGPCCGLVLADLGADVVKVEPLSGDSTRRLKGSGAGYFLTYNRNKRSVAVDLKSASGLDFVKKLVEGADVFIENFRPQTIEGFGLSYQTIQHLNSKLIYCSLKGFLAGPYEHRPALDEVVQMMGGLAYMTGPPGRPLRAGASVNDVMGGIFGAIAILAAVIERYRTGRGQLVKSALFENNMFLVAQHMAQFAITGVRAAPMPVRVPSWSVYDVFDTADKDLQVFVGVVSDRQWEAFTKEFALAELQNNSALKSNNDRAAARSWLLPIIANLFKAFSRDEIMVRCEKAQLPFAPISDPADMFNDPQMRMPGAMTRVTLPNGQVTSLPALPIELKGHRIGEGRDVPRIGEHTSEVMRELGLSEA